MEFIPSDAYIIMGHGEESQFISVRNEISQHKIKANIPTIGTIINEGFADFDSYFIVPDNCMVVVKVRPGEISYVNTIVPLVNKVGDVSKQELFRNPLSNTKELIKELGSVVVYKPGDKCPNYIYYMYSPSDIMEWRYLSHIGLLKTPLQIPFEHKEYNDNIDPDNTPIDNYINTVYRESVYPTSEQVLEIILKKYNDSMKGTNEEGRKMVTSDIPYTSPDDIGHYLSITQKQLLQIGQDGIAKRPGVYYNFVCREIKKKKHKYFINSNNSRQIINPNIQSALNKNKTRRKLIERIIGEAETKRKVLIRNLYTGGKRTRKNRRK